MSSISTSDSNKMEHKYIWVMRIIREFGLPITILAIITWWLAVRVEGKFNNLETKVEIQQKFLQQICVNTSPDSFRMSQCWSIK